MNYERQFHVTYLHTYLEGLDMCMRFTSGLTCMGHLPGIRSQGAKFLELQAALSPFFSHHFSLERARLSSALHRSPLRVISGGKKALTSA